MHAQAFDQPAADQQPDVLLIEVTAKELAWELDAYRPLMDICREPGYGQPLDRADLRAHASEGLEQARAERLEQLRAQMEQAGMQMPDLPQEIAIWRSKTPVIPRVLLMGSTEQIELWARYAYWSHTQEGWARGTGLVAARTLDKLLGWEQDRLSKWIEPLQAHVVCPVCARKASFRARRIVLSRTTPYELSCSHCGHEESVIDGHQPFAHDSMADCACHHCDARRHGVLERLNENLHLIRRDGVADYTGITRELIQRSLDDKTASFSATSFHSRISQAKPMALRILEQAPAHATLSALANTLQELVAVSRDSMASFLQAAGLATVQILPPPTGSSLAALRIKSIEKTWAQDPEWRNQWEAMKLPFAMLREIAPIDEALASADWARVHQAITSLSKLGLNLGYSVPSGWTVRVEATEQLRQALGSAIPRQAATFTPASEADIDAWVRRNGRGNPSDGHDHQAKSTGARKWVASIKRPATLKDPARRSRPPEPREDLFTAVVYSVVLPERLNISAGARLHPQVAQQPKRARMVVRLAVFQGRPPSQTEYLLQGREMQASIDLLNVCTPEERLRAWSAAQALGIGDLFGGYVTLDDDNWDHIHVAAMAQGRTYLQYNGRLSAMLADAPPYTPEPKWRMRPDGTQYVDTKPLLADIMLLDGLEHLVLNTAQRRIVPLRGGWTASLLQALEQAPDVPALEVAAFTKSLRASAMGNFLVPPEPVPVVMEDLALRGVKVVLSGQAHGYYQDDRAPIVTVDTSFEPSEGGRAGQPYFRDGKLVLPREGAYHSGNEVLQRANHIVRQLQEELGHDLSTEESHASWNNDRPVQRWLRARQTLLQLKSQQSDVEIVIDDKFPLQVHSEHPVDFVLDGDTSLDSLALGLEVDGRVLPVASLLHSVVQDEDLYEHLAANQGMDIDPSTTWFVMYEGKYLQVPLARLSTIMKHMQELDLAKIGSGAPGVARSLLLMQAQESLQLRYTGEQQLLAQVRMLFHPPQDVLNRLPAGLPEAMWEVQREGVAWMYARACAKLGGVVADQMGLGKTLQALAFLYLRHQDATEGAVSLVISPKGVDAQWREEMQKRGITLGNETISGKCTLQELEQARRNNQVVFMTYATARLNVRHIEQTQWLHLIADEGHEARNATTDLFDAMHRVNTPSCFPLTGTPWNNSTMDLWPLYQLACPGLLGDLARFRKEVRNPMDLEASQPHFDWLKRRIRPFTLRRTRAQAKLPMPPSTTRIIKVPMGAAQRDLYETIRATLNNEVAQIIERQGFARSKQTVINALLRLRQVTSHPQLLTHMPSAQGVPSAKYEALMRELDDQERRGNQSVVCTQFSSLLDICMADRLKDGKHVGSITGKTSVADRRKARDELDEGELPVLMLAMKAGGTALNLQAANTFILYDRWWNPHAEEQARFRVDRPGQTREMEFIIMAVEGSIDERMAAVTARKMNIAEAIFGDAQALSAEITESDIYELLAPIPPREGSKDE